LASHAHRVYSSSVFALAFAATLQHATLAASRQVLDLGCGGGCWSLMLAGPRLHVTVIVSGIDAHMQALRMVYALDARAHVTLLQSKELGSAADFLSVLDGSASLQNEGFMGFEMVVMLDVLTRLPAVLVRELSAALRPYMHTRSKALVSVLGVSAAAANSAVEWCEPIQFDHIPLFNTWVRAGTSPIGWSLQCLPSTPLCCGAASLEDCLLRATVLVVMLRDCRRTAANLVAAAAISWNS